MQAFPDRFWWLPTLVGIVLVSFLVLLPLAALALTIQLGFSLGKELSVGTLVELLFGLLFWLFISLSLIRHGLHAHADLRRRREAIHADPQRMPLASLSIDAGDRSDLASELIAVLWHGTPAGWRASLFGMVLMGLVVSGCCALGIVLLMQLFTHPAYGGVEVPAATDPLSLRVAYASGWLVLLTLAVSVGIVPLGVMLYFLPDFLAYRGSPNGVLAQPEGVFTTPR